MNSNKYKDTVHVKIARNRFKKIIKRVSEPVYSNQEGIIDSVIEESHINQIDYGTRSADANAFTELALEKKPFVVKFFERSVNLANFDEKTPVYPMCRAWMKSDTNYVVPGPYPDDFDAFENANGEGEANSLPPPDECPVDEEGNPVCLRVPSPLPQPSGITWEINSSGDTAPSPAILFQEHLQRWICARQRWKEAAAENEKRYASSFALLEQMYNKELDSYPTN